MKQVRLRKGKEESLKRFHPWVFSGAIASIDESVTEGDVVRVVTNSGDFIAVGHSMCRKRLPCLTLRKAVLKISLLCAADTNLSNLISD